MKKTLIAAGIAAVMAAPVAMAEVSVGGMVKWTINNGGSSTADSEASTAGEAATTMNSDNQLDFKASEDLGNGLTAFAQISLNVDTSNTAAEDDQKDAKAGIKGAFGTVVYGRMETLTEGVVSAKMDDGASAHVNQSDNLESNITGVGRETAVAYISPTYNGVHFAVAGTVIDARSDTFTDKEILVAYDNGPLSLIGSYADLVLGGGAAQNSDVATLTASYTLGDAKLTAQWIDRDSNGSTSLNDETDTMVRLDYKMGNNTLLLGHKSADAANGDVSIVKLTHNFSKTTSVYAGTRLVDATGEDDDVFVGAMHKF
jgi:predicted porin